MEYNRLRKLLKGYITYQDRNKQLKRGLVMLDTQSNVSYARKAVHKLGQPRRRFLQLGKRMLRLTILQILRPRYRSF